LVVDEEDLGGGVGVRLLQLLELPLAEVAAGVGTLPVLDELRDRLDARSASELAELRQLVVGIDALGQHREDEPALGLAARRRFRLTRCHGPNYASLSLLRLTTHVTRSRR